MIRLVGLVLLSVYIYRSLVEIKKSFAAEENAKKKIPSRFSVPKKVSA